MEFGVSVAHHRLAASERWTDHLGQQLDAGRVEEQRVRIRRAVGRGIKDERPDALAERRATGLASERHDRAAGTQSRGEPPRLLGLAGTVGAFERDEPAHLGRPAVHVGKSTRAGLASSGRD